MAERQQAPRPASSISSLMRSPSQLMQLTPAEQLLIAVPEERKQRISQLMTMLTNARTSTRQDSDRTWAPHSGPVSAFSGPSPSAAPQGPVVFASYGRSAASSGSESVPFADLFTPVVDDPAMGDSSYQGDLDGPVVGEPSYTPVELGAVSSSSSSSMYLPPPAATPPHDLNEQERLLRRRTQNRESAQRRRVKNKNLRLELATQNDLLRDHIKELRTIIDHLLRRLAIHDPEAADVQLPKVPPRLVL